MIKPLDHHDQSIAKQIYQVFQVSYAVEAALLGHPDFPPLKRSVQNIMSSPTLFYGFWKKDVLTAAMEIKANKDFTHIQSLTVDPEYFRRGIGYELLNFAVQSHPSALITVETGLGNTPAILFYENFGFVRQKTWMTEVGIEKIALAIKNSKL